jgi:hypothetical protein
MPARRSRLVTRGATRGAAAAQPPIPAQEFHGSTAGSTQDPRTATAVLKGMSGPGVPSRRGAAVLRRDGQHTGKVIRATRLDVAGASQEADHGG